MLTTKEKGWTVANDKPGHLKYQSTRKCRYNAPWHIYIYTSLQELWNLQPDAKPNEIPDQTISFISIEKSPFSWWRRNNKVNSSSGSQKKNQTEPNKGRKKQTKNTHWYEQKCQSHTCSGTINSSMYDRDLTTTTSPLTSSAPYSV